MSPLLSSSPVLAAGPAHGATGAHTTEGGHGGDHGPAHIPWDTLAYATGTLVLFLTLLVVFARKPVADALKDRSLEIRKGLDEAARKRAEAEARFSDVEARLVALDKRIDEMKAEALADARREEDAIRSRAQADAERIRDTAERTIREEALLARNALQGEAARLAVALARQTIERTITPEDQVRLATQFLDAVKKEARHD